MMNARIAKEIVIRVPDRVDALASVAKLLGDKGINATAISTWIESGRACFRMITEDNLRFGDGLREREFDTHEEEVVLADVAHQIGLLRVITERLLVQRIGILHLYATALADHPRCSLVLSTTNNERTVVLLNERLYEPNRTDAMPANHIFV